jgi:tRNA pseudouridine38-40 synthase
MNIRLDIEYDGSFYSGWQIQRKERSVQSAIEEALAIILRRKVKVIGAGRTDAGVHALGQVANFKVEALPIPPEELKRSLNGLLKEGITLRRVSEVGEDFHARYSAKSRSYVYLISKGKRSIDRNRYFCIAYTPDIGLMRKAAQKLLGAHDFKNISVATGEKSTLCRVLNLEIEDRDREIVIRITADRFLHKMVRMIVGLLLDIGRHKVSLEYLEEALSGTKRKQGFAAPAHGLCLMEVAY